MALALYHPQFGYYTIRHSVLGPQGDFITSPHMGHDFGEIIAEQFVDMWQALDQPNPFTLMEMGAGQGLIAADVLAYLSKNHPDCFNCLNYIVVEKSAALQAEQQKRLKPWQHKGVQLSWQALADIPQQSLIGCAFSNELIDAFPVHWIELHDQKLVEMWVEVGEKEHFQPVLNELSTSALPDYFAMLDIDIAHYPDGYRTEVNLAAIDWLGEVSQCLRRGYVLTIDYGYTAERYYSQARHQGTLQCYYRHRHHNDPFAYLGEQDITAHVNFTALERYGENVGLQKLGFTQQGLFLMALGLGSRLAHLGRPSAEQTAPQTTPQTIPQTTPQTASAQDIQAIMHRREALQQLISPMGFGNFGVLIQGKGLTLKEIARPLKGLTIPPMM
ncbi:MAG: class I SAM-dependent methyltransferase [Phormidesmis sp. RL_2_1]|nr:class I SAM-dependent methyltransferase [Phormidesmis sp. RL_2_1]